MKKKWQIVSGGGWDTFEYINNETGERLVIPGLKQIWYVDKFNIRWWIRNVFYRLEIKGNVRGE